MGLPQLFMEKDFFFLYWFSLRNMLLRILSKIRSCTSLLRRGRVQIVHVHLDWMEDDQILHLYWDCHCQMVRSDKEVF